MNDMKCKDNKFYINDITDNANDKKFYKINLKSTKLLNKLSESKYTDNKEFELILNSFTLSFKNIKTKLLVIQYSISYVSSAEIRNNNLLIFSFNKNTMHGGGQIIINNDHSNIQNIFNDFKVRALQLNTNKIQMELNTLKYKSDNKLKREQSKMMIDQLNELFCNRSPENPNIIDFNSSNKLQSNKENLKRDSSKRESHNGFSYFESQQESQQNRSSSNCNTHQSNAPMYMERVGDSESQSSIEDIYSNVIPIHMRKNYNLNSSDCYSEIDFSANDQEADSTTFLRRRSDNSDNIYSSVSSLKQEILAKKTKFKRHNDLRANEQYSHTLVNRTKKKGTKESPSVNNKSDDAATSYKDSSGRCRSMPMINALSPLKSEHVSKTLNHPVYEEMIVVEEALQNIRTIKTILARLSKDTRLNKSTIFEVVRKSTEDTNLIMEFIDKAVSIVENELLESGFKNSLLLNNCYSTINDIDQENNVSKRFNIKQTMKNFKKSLKKNIK